MHKSLVNRIDNSYVIGNSYGIEYRYPFLDVKLIQFYFDLPAKFKYKDGFGRYVFRKAMEEYLPKEIQWRRDKVGITIPNLQYRIQKDIGLIKQMINEEINPNSFTYFDKKKMLKMARSIERRGKGRKICFGPRILIYAIQILILQKWQREGKIDIGIKC